MNILRKIQYSQYWNIGFCQQTPEELIREKALSPVQWLKHPYRDRWFADPFILKVTNNEIVVFVEECPMENPKGIICELVIDRKTMHLRERYVMLEKDTHLSYPAIIRHEGKVYVYPENGASGKLNIYEYDEANHRLVNPVCILEEAVADATIIQNNGEWFLSATRFPDTQSHLYLYKSKYLFGPYEQMKEETIEDSFSCSRNGGNYFEAYNNLYRSAQDCSQRYGGALSIMSVNEVNTHHEEFAFKVHPLEGRYGLGLHTINYKDGLCVIDGYGYYMSLLGRLYYDFRKFVGKGK